MLEVDISKIGAYMDTEVMSLLEGLAKKKASKSKTEMSMKEALDHFGGKKKLFDKVKQKFKVKDEAVLERVFALCASNMEGISCISLNNNNEALMEPH
jgi:hypothetical protein